MGEENTKEGEKMIENNETCEKPKVITSTKTKLVSIQKTAARLPNFIKYETCLEHRKGETVDVEPVVILSYFYQG